MSKILIILIFVFNSFNCFSAEYVNKHIGVKLNIPNGAVVTEGNTSKPLSDEELKAFSTVFEANPKDFKKALNQTLFTLGYFSGPIENGADASISASIISIDGNDEITSTTNQLIKSEEKENDFMSFKFTEKSKKATISNNIFLVSKGILKIKSEGKVTFSMPIHYYMTKINNLIVLFILSGIESKMSNLEKSLLSMKLK